VIPKRIFWLTVGYTAGAGTSWYAARKVKAAVRRVTPEGMAERVGTSVTGLRRDLRDAVSEGRHAARARETELRTRLGTG
jgi:hypothetical protein